jgi:hypothetical protein
MELDRIREIQRREELEDSKYGRRLADRKVCISICMYIYACVCMYMYGHILMHVYAYKHVYVYI